MAINSYRDLNVWQRGMDLAEQVYRITKKLPNAEIYGLISQMRRAVVSIPSNIAEGYARKSSNAYRHFLLIALGSNSELETQLILCKRIGYLTDEDTTLSLAMIPGNLLVMFSISIAYSLFPATCFSSTHYIFLIVRKKAGRL